MRASIALTLFGAALYLGACTSSEPNRTPAQLAVVTGNNQTGGAGQALPIPLTVRVNDRAGDPVSGVSVAFAIKSGGGNLQGTQVTTSSQGLATSVWTLGTVAGRADTVTASAAGLAGSPIVFTATVQAGAATTATLLQGNNQTGTIGQALGTPIAAQFRDAYNNLAVGQSVTWLVLTGGGTISATSTLTDAQGEATATWTLGYTQGNGQSLRATVGSAQITATATANLSAGTALSIGSGNGQTALAGTALAAPIQVVVRTASAHPVENVPVTWAVATGGGSLGQTTTVTDANGVAATTWTLGSGNGGQTVTASNAALTPTSVTLAATAVVPQPSAITGTVVLVDSQLSAFRSGVARAGLSATSRNEPARLAYGGRVTTPEYAPNDLLVTLRPEAIGALGGARALADFATASTVARAMRARLAAHLVPGRVEIRGTSPVIRTVRIHVADATRRDSVARALAANPAVLGVGLNARARLDGGPIRPGKIPNDPNFPNQSWHYDMVDAPRAWSITTGSSSIIVAVLDNGIVFHHPAIGAAGATYQTGGGNIRHDGYDFVTNTDPLIPICGESDSVNNAGDNGIGYNPDPTIYDDRDDSDPSCLGARLQYGAHGTHVAGTIGAMGNDGTSVTGLNWQVSIRPVRVIGMQFGNYYDIAQGILYASGFPADNGAGGMVTPPAQPARILNMSFGGPCFSGPDPVHDAIQAVTNPANANGGVLAVAAAGNDGSTVSSCPAAYPEVLSVGAVGPSGHRSSFSSYGSTVDLAAPGGEFPPAPGTDGTYGIYSTVCDFTVYPSPCVPGTARYFGTSMAAPHAAGIAALLLAQNPGLTPAMLTSLLVDYVSPLDPSEQLGSGIVDARDALTQTMAPPRQLYVRAVDSATGAVVAKVAASGGNYTLSGLPDGHYYVVAGEDESGDTAIGAPGRRFGAFGGVSNPTAVAVSSSAGAFAAFSIGYPVEVEPNAQLTQANRLFLDGYTEGNLTSTDQTDFYKVQIPASGTYSFETSGFFGNYCGFALDLNTTLTLFDQNGNQLGQSVDIDPTNNNYCSRISQSLGAGTYYLEVSRGVWIGDNTTLHTGRYVLQARTGP